MKKLLTIISLLAIATLTYAQNSTIAVPAPKTMNIGEGNEWIPLFIQGVITTNFQNYSGMKVVDRQNSDMVKAEQRLSENAEFSDADAIEMGKMTHAHLIVTGSITGKASSYALMFSITDAETGETKASATVPNCLFSALENGDAANQISYDLMTGYGVNLSADAKKKLTQKATVMTAENNAQASVAKGIVAENSGSNIEALTYYIQAKKNDKKLSEATSRMANMSTVVSTGNFGKNAKNMIKLRNDWDKLLREAAGLIASNPPTFELVYYSDITLGDIDYDNGVMNFTTSKPYMRQNNISEFIENFKLIDEMNAALSKTPDSKNWGKKINNFPWAYADDIGSDNWMQKKLKYDYKKKNETGPYGHSLEMYTGDFDNALEIGNELGYYVYRFDFSIVDSSKKEIKRNDIVFFASPNSYIENYQRTYEYFDYRFQEEKRGSYKLDNKFPSGAYRSSSNDKFLYYMYVSVDDADTDKMGISIKQTYGDNVSVIPASEAKKGPFIYNGDKNVTKIEIPDGYESITADSFKGCKKLEYIIVPVSVTSIDIGAFKNCKSFRYICLRGNKSLSDVKWFFPTKKLPDYVRDNIIYQYIDGEPATLIYEEKTKELQRKMNH